MLFKVSIPAIACCLGFVIYEGVRYSMGHFFLGHCVHCMVSGTVQDFQEVPWWCSIISVILNLLIVTRLGRSTWSFRL